MRPTITMATSHAAPASQRRLAKLPILRAVAGELHQRHHGEGELEAQDHLAQDEQRAGAVLAVQRRHDHGRDDGDEAGDQPPQPRRQADVEEAFHHDLARQRAGDRRVLARREQRHGEEHARERGAEERRRAGGTRRRYRPRLVAAVWKVAAARIRIAALMKKAKSSATVESSVANRIASRLRRRIGPHAPRLHDGRVQIEVVGHHRGAQDADGDVEHRRDCVTISVRRHQSARHAGQDRAVPGTSRWQSTRRWWRPARRRTPRCSGSPCAAGAG